MCSDERVMQSTRPQTSESACGMVDQVYVGRASVDDVQKRGSNGLLHHAQRVCWRMRERVAGERAVGRHRQREDRGRDGLTCACNRRRVDSRQWMYACSVYQVGEGESCEGWSRQQ